mmetsp:Transcript_3752/g.8707  ORF Transcript_3752/g.8707 Transcript_3752/m.8707 type:complete len:237 (-) Transcript_3752:37-747(-)
MAYQNFIMASVIQPSFTMAMVSNFSSFAYWNKWKNSRRLFPVRPYLSHFSTSRTRLPMLESHCFGFGIDAAVLRPQISINSTSGSLVLSSLSSLLSSDAVVECLLSTSFVASDLASETTASGSALVSASDSTFTLSSTVVTPSFFSVRNLPVPETISTPPSPSGIITKSGESGSKMDATMNTQMTIDAFPKREMCPNFVFCFSIAVRREEVERDGTIFQALFSFGLDVKSFSLDIE